MAAKKGQFPGRCNRELEAGISTALEFAMTFNQWADSRAGGPTWGEIQQRFGCSRATAFRWRNAYFAMKERMAA